MSIPQRPAEPDARRGTEQERSTCGCTSNVGGFTNRGGPGREWWVHAVCGLPTAGWLRAQGGAGEVSAPSATVSP